MYVWLGRQANVLEKAKAMEITKRVSFEEFGGRAKIVEVIRPHKNDEDVNLKKATEGLFL